MRAVEVCPNCGARVGRLEARACEYCGFELPRAPEPSSSAASVSPPPRRVPTPASGDPGSALDARFRALAEHPSLFGLRARTPSAARIVARRGVAAAGGIALTVFALVMLGSAREEGGMLAVVPLAFAGFGVFTVVSSLAKATRAAGARLRRPLARVVGSRTETSGGSHGGGTSGFVTIEDRRGRRRELATTGEVAGRLQSGDMGVAYVRDRFLIGFARVRV